MTYITKITTMVDATVQRLLSHTAEVPGPFEMDIMTRAVYPVISLADFIARQVDVKGIDSVN
jgi:hypothetical protein